jgi:AAA+ ATPase superfamily predicted ATPase
MSKIRNPFITSGYVSAEYFCDRERESAELIRSLTNGQNMAIISPRRMGKTGLIQHCFHNQDIESEYYTFFVDIYATGNLKELVFALGKQIFEELKPKGKSFLDNFFGTITSLRPAFKLDAVTGAPSFDIGIGDIRLPEYSLEQIFNYLETADKRCIVAIDEFQQIAKYPEKNIEAILRTHIQQCKNTNFVLAGSLRHLMQNMFFSASRPFYQSVGALYLDAIASDEYVPFIKKHFADANKTILKENIERVYRLFEGHTWYIQNIFNRLYSLTDKDEACSLQFIAESIDDTIASYKTIFQSILSLLPERQKELLYAIAKEGKASGVTSAAFIKKHGLQSASSVQTALKQLLDKEIITKEVNNFQVYDRFFGLWLSKAYGMGYSL